MRTIFAGLLLGAATCALAVEPAPDADLAALFEREFQYDLQEHPEEATVLGVDGYDDKVTDLSFAAIARRKAHVKATIVELERFDASKLSTQDRISRDMMLYDLRMDDAENALYGDLPFGATSGDGWMKVSSMHGPHSFLTQLSQATRLRLSQATARIREYYTAAALRAAASAPSVDDLLAELDAEDLGDDPLEISVPWEAKYGDKGSDPK